MAEGIARPNLCDRDSSALLLSLDSEEERRQSWACSPQSQEMIQKVYKVPSLQQSVQINVVCSFL